MILKQLGIMLLLAINIYKETKMKKNQMFLTLLISSVISFNAYSAEINSNNISTFTSGTVISSSSVNTTVGEVVTQVNDNNTRINTLEQATTTTSTTDSLWNNIGTTLYYTDGDVGISTNNPDEQLHLGAGEGEAAVLKMGTSSIGRNFKIVTRPGGPILMFQTDDAESNDAENSILLMRSNGNIGIGGVSQPSSKLQIVNGYLQLDVTGGNSPASSDCDSSSEYGRMKVDETNSLLYICMSSGWVSK